MIIDGREVPPGSVVEVDLCVVGGGPAGISLAMQFVGKSGTTVALVESGGLEWDAGTQELSNAESKGQNYFPVSETHLRVLGGSSLAYGGFCTELSDLDFEERPWVPESGWPFEKGALYKYRRRAHELLGVADRKGRPPHKENVNDTVAIEVLAVHPPTRFGKSFAPHLENAPNLTTYLHSTVTNVELHPGGGHIDGVSVKCLGGNHYRIAAKHYALCGGGIEVPRLLLASSNIAKSGVGNRYDNVGRYFQEHPRIFDRYSIPKGATAGSDRIAGVAGTLTFSRLGISEETQRKEELLDYHANLSYGFAGQDTPQWNAVRRVAVALRSPWRDSPYYQTMGGGRNTVRWEDVRKALARPHHAALSLLGLKGFLPNSMRRWVEVASSVEQVPRRDNRVILADERDALGMRRAELHWSLHDQEKRTYYRGRELVLKELDRHMPGLSQNKIDGLEQWPDYVIGTWHHAGTTRMHPDPKQGVVDADAKVHGIDNLFIASSSNFPTSGSTAPTLTIVCLALRLADHLESLLAA